MEEENFRVRINEKDDNEPKILESKTSFPIMKASLKTSKKLVESVKEEPENEIKTSLNGDEIETTRIQTVIEVLDEELLSSDSDASLPMKPNYLEQGELEVSLDFFEKLGSIPNISSLEDKLRSATILRSMEHSKATLIVEGKDVGSFVDPLTGELLPSTAEEEEEEEEEMVTEEESSTTEDVEITEDEELLELLKADQDIEVPKALDDTEVFETFLEMEKSQISVAAIEFDWVAHEREKELKRIAWDTVVFLKELIKDVVEKSEYVDPKILLRQNLDKATLIDEIAKQLVELETEQKARTFLNRRVAEFFYRRGHYRVFTDDPPDTVDLEINKFKDLTTKLDCMLARENELKGTSQRKTAKLQQEVSVLQAQNQENLSELEELVKKTLIYHGECLALTVDSELRTMRKMRDEISAVRYVLIQHQHSNAKLTEQLKQLEDLGNNLQMREYESLQNEVQGLGKKIEERNADLNKSRMRCNADIHIMGHLKQKQAMLRTKIKIQNTMLGELQVQKQVARECIFNSKTQRKQIRKEIRELSYQCGLLDKPALMVDYDATVAEVAATREKVEKLRYKHDEIQRKIENIESKCL